MSFTAIAIFLWLMVHGYDPCAQNCGSTPLYNCPKPAELAACFQLELGSFGPSAAILKAVEQEMGRNPEFAAGLASTRALFSRYMVVNTLGGGGTHYHTNCFVQPYQIGSIAGNDQNVEVKRMRLHRLTNKSRRRLGSRATDCTQCGNPQNVPYSNLAALLCTIDRGTTSYCSGLGDASKIMNALQDPEFKNRFQEVQTFFKTYTQLQINGQPLGIVSDVAYDTINKM